MNTYLPLSVSHVYFQRKQDVQTVNACLNVFIEEYKLIIQTGDFSPL